MPNFIKFAFLVFFLNCHLQEGSTKLVISPKVQPTNLKDAEDLSALLKDVEEIFVAGTPGFLSVFGDAGFSVISGRMGSGDSAAYHPVVAAGRLGNGKIVGCSHDNFLTPRITTGDEPEPDSDKDQFILNAIQWAAGASPVSQIALLLANENDNDTLVDFLELNGISITKFGLDDLQSVDQLQDFPVLITKSFFNRTLAPAIKEFVENGGGFLAGLTSWAHYFFFQTPGHFGANFPGNMVVTGSGFAWRNEDGDPYANPTGENGNYNASTVYLENTRVLEGWREIRNYLISGGQNSSQSLLQFSSIFQYGLEVIPPTDSFWTENNFYEDALNFTQVNAQPIPSADKPVTEPFDKFALQIFHGLSNSVLKPADIRAHPSSVNFPGEIKDQNAIEIIPNSSKSSDKELISISFKKPSWFFSNEREFSDPWSFVPNSINTCEDGIEEKFKTRVDGDTIFAEETIKLSNKRPLWFSTGLYAPPGEIIVVSIDTEDNLEDYQVQIGTHSDDISRHPEWFRAPRVLTKVNFIDNEVTIASPYGGLIYIIVPEDEISEIEKTYQTTVSGSVKAPLYKLGETSIREWRESIRHASGAWAEFVTDKVIITVPSSSIRNLDDPEDLLLFWDQVMDAIADLAAIPRERYRPERLVSDVQISAGFMHSGYPIMTFLEEGNLAVNVTTLRTEGSWGHFHELGHNHQSGDWTFDGTGETTCNLFSLYVLNTVCGIPAEKTREQLTPEWYKKRISDYITNGRGFQEWKNDAFLSLLFYYQLERVYGWVAYKQVFANYHQLEEHPATEEERMDLWLIMFSKVVEEDLSLFFESWGIPISVEASSAVSGYPEAGFLIFDMLND